METNPLNNQKLPLTPLQKMRLREEASSYISDHGLSTYIEYMGTDFTEMKGKLVLDIGSGENEKFSKEAAENGVRVVSMSPHLKKGATKSSFIENWQNRSVAGRAQEMPFRKDTFDYEVALFSVPYYLSFNNESEYKFFLKEVIRTLKPGGKAYIVPMCGDGSDNMVSRDFAEKVLSQLSGFITYELVKLPEPEDKEYRLVLTKNSGKG